MNPAIGNLRQNGVYITNSKDIGRLYGKSRFGIIQSKNRLKLDFLEACFLCEEKKLVVVKNKKHINFENLITIASAKREQFETDYLIFRDLRRRGHQIELLIDDSSFNFYTKNQQDQQKIPAFITTFSERKTCTIQHLLDLIEESKEQSSNCWLTIADEEGDITYYHLNSEPLIGQEKQHTFKKSTGILLKDRVILFNEKAAAKLHEKEFFGKEFAKGIQISLVEALYLVKNNSLQITLPTGEKLSPSQFEKNISSKQKDIKKRFIVFDDLKKQGLIVKTGFKFGNHFRAYTALPDKTHAEYLIHAVSLSDTLEWAEVSRAIRLAHSVNKTFLFASIGKNNIIRYLAFKRIRP